VETAEPISERKRFRGKLLGLDGEGQVKMLVDGVEWVIPLGAVKTAKLVLTDELIAAAMRQQQQ
jgi:ribosome maturation factor RimP